MKAIAVLLLLLFALSGADAFPRGGLVASGGSGGLVQNRVLTNFSATSSPANAWIPIGQSFAQGQIPAGDGVAWKTGGGTTLVSQADDYVKWPDGSLRFAAFNVRYPTGLAPSAQDTIGAYDAPSAGFNNTCFNASPSSLITAHDIRLEATTANSMFQATVTGGVMTVTGTVTGTAIVNGATVWVSGTTTSFTITSFGTGTGGAGTYNISDSVLVISTSSWMGAGSTTWTLGANNEFTNEPTKPILYRTGPSVCAYSIPGEIRNGTTFGSTAQGLAWGNLYIEVRSDGTYKVWGQVFPCRPLTTANAAITGNTCSPNGIANNAPTLIMVPDANGDAFAIKDYSLGTPILMGCANTVSTTVGGCVAGGHATGGAFSTFTGYRLDTVTGDGFPFDSQPDAHKIFPALPLIVSANSATRGIYDAVLMPNLGYNAAQISHAAIDHVEPAAGPNACLAGYGCVINQPGNSAFIGLLDMDTTQCYLAGQTTSGWQACDNVRRFALVQGSINDSFRDASTGLMINMAPHYTASAPMRTNTAPYLCGSTISQLLCSVAQGHAAQALNHQPMWGFGAYMLSGERPFLDFMYDQVGFDVGQQNPAFRNTTLNGHTYDNICQFTGATRLSAWCQRDLSNALWLSPDLLADQVTANPVKGYLAWITTGTMGDLAYFNDWMTAPNYTTAQQALGFMKGPSPPQPDTSLPGGYQVHQDQWEDSYMSQVWYQDVARNQFSSSNCIAAFSGNGVHACPIFTEFFHKHFLGMGVNGCMAYAAPVYNYSHTNGPYVGSGSVDSTSLTSSNMAQVWTDVTTGDVESPVIGGVAGTPPATNATILAGQAPGTTLQVSFGTAPVLNLVGLGPAFFGGNALSAGGVTIPSGTYVTAASTFTGGACTTGTCYTLTFNNAWTGTNPVPTTTTLAFYGWTRGNTVTTNAQQPWPLIPASGCPSEGLDASYPSANNGSYVVYYYDGFVWADRVGDSYGAVGRQYFENYNGSPSPGGVKPLGDCAGGYATWDTGNTWNNDNEWAGQPQWHVWPISAPQTDSLGRSTGCN